METQDAPLGQEDYQALAGMLMSPDTSIRTQGQGLAKKLTPAEQQTFFDVQKTLHAGKGERVDSDIASGIPVIGSVSPEMAVATGVPLASAAAKGVGAVASTLGSQAATQAKYWATKTALEHLGLPSFVAEAAAVAASGAGRKGGKAEPTVEPSPADAPHLDLSRPVRPGGLTPAQMAERTAAIEANGGLNFPRQQRGPGGRPVKVPSAAPPVADPVVSPVASDPVVPAPQAAPSAPVAAPPPTPETQSLPPVRMDAEGRLAGRAGGNPDLPDQKALNEAGLARRRAEYQAKLAEKGQPQPPATTPDLTVPERAEYLRLRQAKKTHDEAMELIEAQRVFQERFGLATPTVDDVRFPKGMRGKLPPSAGQ